jgi:Cu+-exporting ATPase
VAYWRNRLIVGVALTVPLVFLGYAPMMLRDGSHGHRPWIAWVMFGLAGVLQAYLGGPYLRGAWGRLRHGSSNMDTLIALGTTAAFGSSVVHLLLGRSWGTPWLLLTIAAGIIVAVSLVGAVLFGEPPTFGHEGRSIEGMPVLDEHARH